MGDRRGALEKVVETMMGEIGKGDERNPLPIFCCLILRYSSIAA